MSRPKFVTEEDLKRWSQEIENSPKQIRELANSSIIIKEVCYAGLYLAEQLEKLGCPAALITRIQFSAGKESFGKDTWDTHLQFLEGYKKGELDFVSDENELN
jgi:hypothetical protein